MFHGANMLEAVKRRFGVKPRGAVLPLDTETQAPSPSKVRVRGSNAQPQSDRDIKPIIDTLREMDPLLNVRWNPEAILLEKGFYTGSGQLVPPVYEGRWQVIRDLPRGEESHDGKPYLVIVTVTQPARDPQYGHLLMVKDGAYAPVGQWLIEYMRAADAANVRAFTELRERMWKQHDQIEERAAQIDEGEAREGLDRVHFKANYAGGQGNWSGKGADFGEMENKAKSPLIIP